MRVMLVDPMHGAGTIPLATRRGLRGDLWYPGLGLYSVAALTPAEVQVRVVDESVENIPDDFAPDLVGISVEAPTAPRAYALSSELRAAGIPVVLGGIHVSLNPAEARQHADAIVIGEAHHAWPRLLDDFRNRKMKSAYRTPGFADLDTLPSPRRDLMPAQRRQRPSVVQASKGCPFGCEFCSLSACTGQVARFRACERVVAEIRDLPGNPVLFIDDNVYANRDYARRLFRALTPLGRPWVAESTWHIGFDDETLGLARDSGCVGLFVGFDAINRQHMIRKVPGSGNPEEIYVKAMRNIAGRGIACVAAFVFGLDGDDTTVFERALNVVRSGGASLACFNVLVPYPGTPVFRRLQREDRITEWDWSRYVSPNVCFRPKRMSAAELLEGTLWAQREFLSLGSVLTTAAQACFRLGWARGLMALKLNLAQRRNWPFGTFGVARLGRGKDGPGDG